MLNADAPFFTIIIPTLNAAKDLPVALKSIDSQTFKSVEVIIVDGGSQDATIEIANKYPKLVRKVISQKGLGIYAAMNVGIEQAKGEWLLFLGADDTLFR